MNLTSQQKDLLSAIVDAHLSGDGAPFIFVQSRSGSGLCYPRGRPIPVNVDEVDFLQLAEEGLINVVRVSGTGLRGKPTQLGIDTVASGRSRSTRGEMASSRDPARLAAIPTQGIAEGGMPDPIPLSGLVANDPRNCLSDSARWRISEAYGKDELIRTRALADLEMRFKSKADPNRTFLEYCDSGSAAVKLNRAKLDGARSILSAVLREFRAFGMPVPALAHVMEDELDSLADSAGLTTIEQQLLRKELDVYGQTVPGLMIPEPEPGTSDDAKVAKQSRAITVARLIRELNDLKPQMFEDESEYNRLRTLYPGFLTFRIAEERPARPI